MIAGFRCDLRCCPHCQARYALRIADRVRPLLDATASMYACTMITLTTRPRWGLRTMTLNVGRGMQATQRALRAAPGVLGTFGALEWGEESGLAHAHIMVLHDGISPTRLRDLYARPAWLAAGLGHIIHAEGQAHDDEGVYGQHVAWYLLEYVTKSAGMSPIHAANACLSARYLRRYRCNGAFDALPKASPGRLSLDGEIMQPPTYCPHCEDTRRVVAKLAGWRPLDSEPDAFYIADGACGRTDTVPGLKVSR